MTTCAHTTSAPEQTEYGSPPGYRLVACGAQGRFSMLIHRRVAVVSTILLLSCCALMVLAVGVGGSSLTYADVLKVLAGEAAKGQAVIVFQWRMPRILLAVLVGAALGVAGAIFQIITRNPLGTPDIIGFTMGAQAGILIMLVLFGGSLAGVSLAALMGGIACGGVIFLFSFHSGFSGLRLILAGIAISSMIGSFNSWIILTADLDVAYGAMKATTGTLASADWGIVTFCLPAAVGVFVLITVFSRSLRNLELGQQIAMSLGTNTTVAQAILLLLGTALVAISTTAAGPIGFIALVAPHIARLLSRTPVPPLFVSGAMGALLLLGSDVLSQVVLESMPVGIVTAALGGFYFMGLLLTEARKKI